MRVWDISPGYLSRTSLLGEHRELHGLISIHINQKKGYSRHPETMRWTNTLGALAFRHELLVAEMRLRGYKHHSPLSIAPGTTDFPPYIDAPAKQISLLCAKYDGKQQGRTPLPRDKQELWQHHCYSVLARSEDTFLELERNKEQFSFGRLAEKLVEILRQPPGKTEFHKAVALLGGLSPDQQRATTFLGEMSYWMKDKEYSNTPVAAAFSRSMQ
jgi:hypothetical protein